MSLVRDHLCTLVVTLINELNNLKMNKVYVADQYYPVVGVLRFA